MRTKQEIETAIEKLFALTKSATEVTDKRVAFAAAQALEWALSKRYSEDLDDVVKVNAHLIRAGI